MLEVRKVLEEFENFRGEVRLGEDARDPVCNDVNVVVCVDVARQDAHWIDLAECKADERCFAPFTLTTCCQPRVPEAGREASAHEGQS